MSHQSIAPNEYSLFCAGKFPKTNFKSFKYSFSAILTNVEIDRIIELKFLIHRCSNIMLIFFLRHVVLCCVVIAEFLL